MEVLWESLRRLIPEGDKIGPADPDANLEFEGQWDKQTPRQILQQFFDEDR